MFHTIWPFRSKKSLPILALTAAIPLAVTIAPTIDIESIRINLFPDLVAQKTDTDIQPTNQPVATDPVSTPSVALPEVPKLPESTPLVVTQPSPVPIETPANGDDSLAQLQSDVANGLMQEALFLTRDLLSAAVGQAPGYIKSAALEKAPQACKALVDIDRAWHQGSGGRYSFSKQLEIYKQAQAGNGRNKYQDFMIKVAWADPEKGILSPMLTNAAPVGHLPYWDYSFKEPGDTSFHLFRIFESCKKNPLL